VPPYQAINQAAGLIIPEIILLATVCVMFLTGPFLVSETGKAPAGLRHRWGILSLLALGAAMFAWMKAPILTAGAGPFRPDEFVWFVRGVSLIGGILLTLVLWDQIDDGHAAEAHACLLAILAGVNFVALSNDLVGIFLGLELVSIPTYILLYLARRDWMTNEATIKYFLLSIFSSAFVLYGLSWVFGIAGTTNLTAITANISAAPATTNFGMFRLAMVLIIAGLSFRLTAVPFHFYAPDVFQGVTSSSAAMLSFVPKVVGFTALLRLLPVCFGEAGFSDWMPVGAVRVVLMVLAILTMFVGNLMALRQTSVMRLLAYSSIAHAGYMLVGLTVGNSSAGTSGVASLLFYLSMYGIMTIGLFALISAAGTFARPLRSLSDLAGLSRNQPAIALMMAVCLIGLSGLPPTGGFLAKLNLFLAAWSQGSTDGRILAITLAVNAVIAATYYLRLISVMYFEQSTVVPETSRQPAAWIAGCLCAVATLALFLMPQPLWDAAVHALSHQ
jgi:NADH-quinone oxidoreductase subunit N